MPVSIGGPGFDQLTPDQQATFFKAYANSQEYAELSDQTKREVAEAVQDSSQYKRMDPQTQREISDVYQQNIDSPGTGSVTNALQRQGIGNVQTSGLSGTEAQSGITPSPSGDNDTLATRKAFYQENFKKVLKFPTTLGPQFMAFNFLNYEYNKEYTGGRSEIFENAVILPLPTEGLTDTVNIDYTNSHVNLLNVFLYNAYMDIAAREGVGATTSQIMTELYEGGSTIMNNPELLLRMGVFGDGEDGMMAMIERQQGKMRNPYASLKFSGVKEPRSYDFTWTLVPETPEESDIIKDISQTFRYHSLPEVTGEMGMYLKYPNVCQVMLAGMKSDYYMFLKNSFIKSYSFSFGKNNFFRTTGAPGSVVMKISLQEIRPLMRQDIMNWGYEPSVSLETPNSGSGTTAGQTTTQPSTLPADVSGLV